MTTELERLAIVGTGQRGASGDELTGTAVDALVDRVPGLDRERALLLRVGALAVARRAARIHTPRGAPIAAAPPDPRREAGPRLEALLDELLALGEVDVLDEALERMAAAGLRLPEPLLPRALGVTEEERRRKLRPVLGERGHWLAAYVRAGAWAIAPEPAAPSTLASEARWDEATSAERRAMLAALRAVDPAAARRLVERSFASDKAEQRAACLEILAAAPTADDEAFFESALADRSPNVRLLAARALWQIPSSAAAGRMRQRVDALVSAPPPPSAGLLAKMRSLVGGSDPRGLQVELPPEALAQEWERDGVVEEAPKGIGRRQWWLSQLLSAVDPRHWVERLGRPPAEIVALARAHELVAALLDGLTSAALRFDARDWMPALWDHWETGQSAGTPISGTALVELSARLIGDDADARMTRVLASERVELLCRFARPWPRAFAARFLKKLESHPPALASVLPRAAIALPLDLLPASISIPEADARSGAEIQYLRSLESFSRTLGRRRILLQEIPS